MRLRPSLSWTNLDSLSKGKKRGNFLTFPGFLAVHMRRASGSLILLFVSLMLSFIMIRKHKLPGKRDEINDFIFVSHLNNKRAAVLKQRLNCSCFISLPYATNSNGFNARALNIVFAQL